MSKRSPGSKAAMKKGKEIHRKERDRHREKVRAKAEREKNESVSDVLTDVINETAEHEEKDAK